MERHFFTPSLDLCTETLRASLMLCALGGVSSVLLGSPSVSYSCHALLPTRSFISEEEAWAGGLRLPNLGFVAGAHTSALM